jgi:hypothetical protein
MRGFFAKGEAFWWWLFLTAIEFSAESKVKM